MVPVPLAVKAEIVRGGSEKTDYRNPGFSETTERVGRVDDALTPSGAKSVTRARAPLLRVGPPHLSHNDLLLNRSLLIMCYPLILRAYLC